LIVKKYSLQPCLIIYDSLEKTIWKMSTALFFLESLINILAGFIYKKKKHKSWRSMNFIQPNDVKSFAMDFSKENKSLAR